MVFLQLALGYVIGRMLVSILFIPAYFRGELFTSYELLQRVQAIEESSRSHFVMVRHIVESTGLAALNAAGY